MCMLSSPVSAPQQNMFSRAGSLSSADLSMTGRGLERFFALQSNLVNFLLVFSYANGIHFDPFG